MSGWRRSFAYFAALLAGAAALPDGATHGSEADQRPLRIKAAFVLNIARFVTWPEAAFDGPRGSVTLCLFRSNSFGSAVNFIRGKKVGHRPLDVVVVQRLQGQKCHVLFLRGQDLDHQVLSVLDAPSPFRLTIVDRTLESDVDIRPSGGIVTLVRNETRIGFEVDLKAARKAGLTLSSEFLKLARVVEPGS